MNLTKLELSLQSVCFSSLPDPTGTVFSIRFLIARECPFKTERFPFFLALLWVEISGGTWQVLRRPLQYIPNWSWSWLHILNLLASTHMIEKNPIRKNLLALTKCIIIVSIIIIIIQNIKVESKEFAFYFSYFIFEVVENNRDKIPVPFNPAVQILILRCKFRSITRGTLLNFVSFRFKLFIFPSKDKGGNIDLTHLLYKVSSSLRHRCPLEICSGHMSWDGS